MQFVYSYNQSAKFTWVWDIFTALIKFDFIGCCWNYAAHLCTCACLCVIDNPLSLPSPPPCVCYPDVKLEQSVYSCSFLLYLPCSDYLKHFLSGVCVLINDVIFISINLHVPIHFLLPFVCIKQFVVVLGRVYCVFLNIDSLFAVW